MDILSIYKEQRGIEEFKYFTFSLRSFAKALLIAMHKLLSTSTTNITTRIYLKPVTCLMTNRIA